jgi:hypothetical protein
MQQTHLVMSVITTAAANRRAAGSLPVKGLTVGDLGVQVPVLGLHAPLLGR